MSCGAAGRLSGHSARWVGPMVGLGRWVGPMVGLGRWVGPSYVVTPALLPYQERGYFCASGGEVAQHLQDLELVCEVLDAQR